jgi:hypothetical protein
MKREILLWRENGGIGHSKVFTFEREGELQQGYMDFWSYQIETQEWGFYCADELEFSKVDATKVPHDIRAVLLIIQ